jgi:hypothetical protein
MYDALVEAASGAETARTRRGRGGGVEELEEATVTRPGQGGGEGDELGGKKKRGSAGCRDHHGCTVGSVFLEACCKVSPISGFHPVLESLCLLGLFLMTLLVLDFFEILPASLAAAVFALGCCISFSWTESESRASMCVLAV